MKRIEALLTVLALLTASCGGSFSDTIEVRLPFLLGQGCSLPLESAWARVHIAGGFEACDLNVDALSGEASGRCDDITTGEVRPLAIEWGQDADTTTNTGVLAYTLGAVDLRLASLPVEDEHPTVTVDLRGAATVDNEPDFAALAPPEGNCQLRDEGDIEQWMWCYRKANLDTDLDCDDDGISNLSEACAGSLSCP